MTVAFEEEVKPLNSDPLLRAALTWFEIPTLNIRRAVAFYQTVLAQPLIDISDDEPMFLLPLYDGRIGGALIQREGVRPGPRGAVVYLRVMDSLAAIRNRVVAAGGALVTEITARPRVPGVFCVVRDIEGNRIGLHAEN